MQPRFQLVFTRTTLILHDHMELSSFFTRKLENMAYRVDLSLNSKQTHMQFMKWITQS